MGLAIVGREAKEQRAVGGVDAGGLAGDLGAGEGVFGAGGAAVPDGDDKISGVDDELVAFQGGAAVKIPFIVGADDADGDVMLCGIGGGKAVHPVCAAGNQFGGAFRDHFFHVHLCDRAGADDGNDQVYHLI